MMKALRRGEEILVMGWEGFWERFTGQAPAELDFGGRLITGMYGEGTPGGGRSLNKGMGARSRPSRAVAWGGPTQ